MKPPQKSSLPMWATREFRWLVISAVMGVGIVAVLIFEIGPRSQARVVETPPDLKLLVPAEWRDGKAVGFHGMLEGVKDRAPLPTDGRDPVYGKLLRHLLKSDETMAGKSVDYRIFGIAPEEARGRMIKVTALFVGSTLLRVNPEGSEVEFIHRTFLSDLSGREGYVVDLLQAPPPVEKRGLVSVDAVFQRLATYEAQRGPVVVPLFLGRSLRVETERSVAGASVPSVGPWVTGVVIGTLALMTWLSIRLWGRWRAGSRGIPPFVPTRG